VVYVRERKHPEEDGDVARKGRMMLQAFIDA
jgi:hypothetical protein